jgi:hypothetical protein
MTGYITSTFRTQVSNSTIPQKCSGMHKISQISMRACSIDVPRISYFSHHIHAYQVQKHQNRTGGELLEFLIGFDKIQPPDLPQASLPGHPHSPPRFDPPNSRSHVTAALAIKARLDPNRSIIPNRLTNQNRRNHSITSRKQKQ